eukprot:g81739.t1
MYYYCVFRYGVQDRVLHFYDSFMGNCGSVVSTPEFALIFLIVIFILYTGWVYYFTKTYTDYYKYFPDISLLGASHPAFVAGIIAICALAAIWIWFWCLRLYIWKQFKVDQELGMYVVLFLGVCIGLMQAAGYLLGSALFKTMGFYMPFIVLAASALMQTWRQQGYYFNSWLRYEQLRYDTDYNHKVAKLKELLKKTKRGESLTTFERSLAESEVWDAQAKEIEKIDMLSPRNVPQDNQDKLDISMQTLRTPLPIRHDITLLEDALTLLPRKRQLFRPGSQHIGWLRTARDLLMAFFTLRHQLNDYLILCWGLATILLVVFQSQAMQNGWGTGKDSQYFGQQVTFWVGILVLSTILVIQWITCFRVSLVIAAILVFQLGYGTYSFVLSDLDQAKTFTSLSLLYLLLPLIILLVVFATTSLQAKNWVAGRHETLLFAAAFAMAFALEIAAICMDLRTSNTEDTAARSFGVVVTAVACYLVFFGLYASQSLYVLPRLARTNYLIVALITIAIVAAMLVLKYAWFYVFSIFVLILGAVALAHAALDLLFQDESVLLPSQFVFPVYAFRADLRGKFWIKPANRGTSSLCLCTVLAIVWGFIEAIYEPTEGWIGWLAICAGEITIALTICEARFGLSSTFWHAYELVEGYPDLVESLRDQAIRSQWRTGGEEWANAARVVENTGVGAQTTEPGDNKEDEMGGATHAAMALLKSVRLYWDWEETSQVEQLVAQRNGILSNASIRVRKNTDTKVSEAVHFSTEKSGLTSKEIRERDVAKGRHWAQLTNKIARTFDLQGRTLMAFQLLVLNKGRSMMEQRSVMVKDFLRKSEEIKKALQHKNAGQVLAWIKYNRNRVTTATRRYVTKQSKAIVSRALEKENRRKMQGYDFYRCPDFESFKDVFGSHAYSGPGQDLQRVGYGLTSPPKLLEELVDICGNSPEQVQSMADKAVSAALEALTTQSDKDQKGVRFCDLTFPSAASLPSLLYPSKAGHAASRTASAAPSAAATPGHMIYRPALSPLLHRVLQHPPPQATTA